MMKSIAKGDNRAKAKTKPRGVADVRGGVGIANRALAVTKAWSEIDFAGRRLDLPAERTKAGGKLGRRRIQLNQAAVDLLRSVERTPDCPLVFPAAGGATPTKSVQDAWEKVRLRADLSGVRLHDLRHTFASFAVADGASLYLVAQALA